MYSKITFIGLGVMGYPMAGHLRSNGLPVQVYNRTSAKAEHWHQQHGGEWHASLDDAVHGADLVITCVSRDQDLHELMMERGVLDCLAPGSIVVDHSTTSASLARALSLEAAKRSLGFIDAPVSGGQQGAEKGQLTIMCGGTEDQFEQVKPVLSNYAKAVTRMGECGSGQLTKMVNQIAVAGVLQGLSEALHFAEQAGLDGAKVLDVISKGAAQSWQMENRGATMLRGEYNFGFAVDLMRKDLDLLLTEAKRAGASLPSTALIDQFYADVQNIGGSRWDTSSLLERLRYLAGTRKES